MWLKQIYNTLIYHHYLKRSEAFVGWAEWPYEELLENDRNEATNPNMGYQVMWSFYWNAICNFVVSQNGVPEVRKPAVGVRDIRDLTD